MNPLVAFDQVVFFAINQTYRSRVIDAVALVASGIGTAGFVWFLIGSILFIREERRDHWFFAPLFLAGASSWIVVELMFKPLVGRLRPTPEMGAIILGADTSSSYSFPSGHATIAWAMAVVLSQKMPRWRPVLYMLASVIALSRVYIGKHYPGDIIIGSLLGWGIGALSLYLTSKKPRLGPLK